MAAESVRIVVVDDHPLLREGVRRLLEHEPDLQCVGQAGKPDDALALIETARPDLVLLDLRLADAHGIDLLSRIAAMPWAPHVLIVTAFPDEAMIAEAIRLGARGFVLKDADPDTLRQAIRTVAGGELWFPAELTLRVITSMIPSGVALRLRRLSPREREIAALVAQGAKNREIGERLLITERDIQLHLANIFEKLGVEDRLELALLAIKLGLVSPPSTR
jgi:DNA-binding NarL/FixJ family response regulator